MRGSRSFTWSLKASVVYLFLSRDSRSPCSTVALSISPRLYRSSSSVRDSGLPADWMRVSTAPGCNPFSSAMAAAADAGRWFCTTALTASATDIGAKRSASITSIHSLRILDCSIPLCSLALSMMLRRYASSSCSSPGGSPVSSIMMAKSALDTPVSAAIFSPSALVITERRTASAARSAGRGTSLVSPSGPMNCGGTAFRSRHRLNWLCEIFPRRSRSSASAMDG